MCLPIGAYLSSFVFFATANIPYMIQEINAWLNNLPRYAWNFLLIASALVAGLILKLIIALLLKLYAKRERGFSFFGSALKRMGKSLNYFLPLVMLYVMLPMFKFSRESLVLFERYLGIALIISLSALLISSIRVIEDWVYNKFDFNKTDNLSERKIRTQLQFLKKVLVGLIIIVAVCAVMLSFPGMRRIGAGMLTGVGIGGIIIGFAAQKSLANLLAGFQIAFTQPLRIDDVVIIQGQWGRVEEITLTYVVVRIWDMRRLIIPVTHIIENPFENWTRASSELLGTVMLYVDYSAPVEEIRKAFDAILAESSYWDGKTKAFQVTNASERTLELRALMSAKDSGTAFDLRCEVREKLIGYIRQHHPGSLPRIRLHNEEAAEAAGAAETGRPDGR